MKADNWIALAAVLVAILAPFLHIWYKNKLETSRDRATIRKEAASRRRVAIAFSLCTVIAPIFSVTLNVFFIYREVTSPAPLTKYTVFAISLYIALIFSVIVFVALLRFSVKMNEEVVKMNKDVVRIQHETVDLMSRMETVFFRIRAHEKSLNSNPEEGLDK